LKKEFNFPYLNPTTTKNDGSNSDARTSIPSPATTGDGVRIEMNALISGYVLHLKGGQSGEGGDILYDDPKSVSRTSRVSSKKEKKS
jgi:hypothetical protein